MKSYQPKAKGRGIDRIEVHEDAGKSILITLPCVQVDRDADPLPHQEVKRQEIFVTSEEDICQKIREITGNDPVGLEPMP